MYLRSYGASVEITDDADRAAFRAGRGVPDEVASCHTAIIDEYAIEGHVPVGAITRLLADRPDAIGLALAGMPVESPGMGGDASTWEQQPVMLIEAQGKLAGFDY